MPDIHYITEDERLSLQNCLLKMLKDIDFVCKKYNLTYMLGGGTALGAVRHQGFIPWDDDLDINMPRDDYDRLLGVMEKELGDYYDFSYPQSSHVEYPFLKIYKKGTRFVELLDDMEYDGIWIDVFPVEFAPDNKVKRFFKGIISDFLIFGLSSSLMIANKNNKLTKAMFLKDWRRKIRYYLAIMLGKILFFWSYKKVINFSDWFVRGSKDSSIVTVPTGRAHYLGECLPINVVFPIRKIKFCDMDANVYNNVEIYLRKLYGNYMKIPPEDKREKHYIADFFIMSDVKWKVVGGEQGK